MTATINYLECADSYRSLIVFLNCKLYNITKTVDQRFVVSKVLYFKEINTLIQQGCTKLIKSDSNVN